MRLPDSLLLAAGLALLCTSEASAQLTSVRVATGLSSPTDATGAPGDFQHLYILEQRGRIQVLDLLTGQISLFMDLQSKVVMAPNSEQGLLGLAFHPSYPATNRFYVYYTGAGGDSLVEQYSTLDPLNGDPSSGVTVIGPITQPQSNHNGGCLQFGPDGMLYVGLGDGGNFNDTGPGHVAGGNAQSLSNLLGSLLRLDVDQPFPHIPPDNPFVGGSTSDDPIWSYGLRNPWRFSFDRATGDLYLADVGQNSWEEIDFEPPGTSGGRNYGWRCMEGLTCTGFTGCTCNDPALTLPFQVYNHSLGKCAITGGYVYRGLSIPSLAGTYFYADLCSNQIWSLEYDGTTISNFTERTAELTPNAGMINSVASFAEDTMGEIYLLDLGGEIFKIVPSGMTDCNGNFILDSAEIAVGLAADVNGNGVPDDCDCPAPFTYCVSKISSQFCLPAIRFTGAPKAPGSGGSFTIDADMILNAQSGLLFFGLGQNQSPFQGGTLCVAPPLQRTAIQSSGGTSPPAADCSGTLSFDMQALIDSGSLPFLTAGATVDAQYWYRDPNDLAGFGVGLSDAVEFFICNL